MSKLARADLNQLQLDLDSFIGKAIAAGLEYEHLPSGFVEGLKTYLRIRGMGFAQRQRTGIALGKDQLRQGIEMGLVCLDLALEQEAGGDLNAAVELLAAGQFEELYARGWELAFGRLEKMRQRSVDLARCPELAFWPEAKSKVEAWARLTPETWTGVDAEGETVAVDLAVDVTTLAVLESKVAFVHSLPGRSVKALLNNGEVVFAGVLHRVVLALALGRVGLVASRAEVFRFRDECFAQGAMRPELRQQVVEQVVTHLNNTVQDPEARVQITAEFHEGLEQMEKAAAGHYLDELFLPLEQLDGAEAARVAAEADEAGDEFWFSAEKDELDP